MTGRTIGVTLLALICGISAALGVSRLRTNKVEQGSTVETAPVVVATVDLPRGRSLTPDVVQVQDWPKASVPEGAISSVEQVVNRTVLSSLANGEIVLEKKLSAPGRGGLASMVPAGMRAYTIMTPSLDDAVAGFVLPGNKVDILITRRGPSSASGSITETLLQNVEILAAGALVEAPAENRVDVKQLQSVTLLVTLQQAERLAGAQKEGELALVLRGDGDEEVDEPTPEPEPLPVAESSSLIQLVGKFAEAMQNAKDIQPPEESDADGLSQPQDQPIYTLRGSQWGYVLSRRQIPTTPPSRE